VKELKFVRKKGYIIFTNPRDGKKDSIVDHTTVIKLEADFSGTMKIHHEDGRITDCIIR